MTARASSCLRYALICASLTVCQSVALASPHYVFGPFLGGDEVTAVDLNDLGTVLMTGREGSYYVPAGGKPFDVRVRVPGYLGDLFGTEATSINNNNDLLGRALKDGQWVPTLWIDDIPFDLTDPANAGLSFVRDPGPGRALVNLYELEVLGQPFPDDPNGQACNYLTNARGDFVAEYFAGYNCGTPFPTGYALLTKVPEPSSLALIMIGLAGATWAGRRSRRSSSRG